MPVPRFSVGSLASADSTNASHRVLVLDGEKWDLSNLSLSSFDDSALPHLDGTVASSSGRRTEDDDISTLGGASVAGGGGMFHSYSSPHPPGHSHPRAPRVSNLDEFDTHKEDQEKDAMDKLYPSKSDLPACLDVDDIFAKLKEAKLLKTAKIANPRLGSRYSPSPRLMDRKRASRGAPASSSYFPPLAPPSWQDYPAREPQGHQRHQARQADYAMPSHPRPRDITSQAPVISSPSDPYPGVEEERRQRDQYYKRREELMELQHQRRIQQERDMLRREREEEEMLRAHQLGLPPPPPPPLPSQSESHHGIMPRSIPDSRAHSQELHRVTEQESYYSAYGDDGVRERRTPQRQFSSSSYEYEEEILATEAEDFQEESKEQTLVEVTPGNFVPLIGSESTWSAVQEGRIAHTTCFDCMARLVCINVADMIMCPECRVISPVSDESGKASGGGGLGLGMKEEDAMREVSNVRNANNNGGRYY